MTLNIHRNFTIHKFEETPSTNDLAFELAKKNKIDHNHVIVSKKQTKGKGRYGRVWESDVGNLYFSILLKPTRNNLSIFNLSFIASVSLGLALDELSNNLGISYKWPNDVLINNKKIAGILLESEIKDNLVVVGIGININSNPNKVRYPASNLKNENLEIEKDVLLIKFLDKFEEIYQKWLDFGFTPIRNLWLQKAHNLNKEITSNLKNKQIKGIFRDLDENGNLVLEIKDKGLELISSGEIF